MSERDTLKQEKDTLLNFATFMEKRGVKIGEEVVEGFLSTQTTGPRFVACCTHCGGAEVTADDFSKRPPGLVYDARTKAMVEEIKDPDEKGPAWKCVCGHWSPREAS